MSTVKAHDAWCRGSLRESSGTAGVIAGVLGLQALLLLWWWAQHDDVGGRTDDLERQLVHLLGFLGACTTVLVITQAERVVERPTGKAKLGHLLRLGCWVLVWGLRVVLAGALLAWVVHLFVDDDSGIAGLLARLGVAVTAVIAVVSLIVTGVRVLNTRRKDKKKRKQLEAQEMETQEAEAQQAQAQQAADQETAQADETEQPEASSQEQAPSEEPDLTLALSGGGIRAATFALGAWNGLSQHHKEVDEASGPLGPRLVAVSGGSYLAASIALLRTFVIRNGVATPDTGPLPAWHRTYAVGSAESNRLRRHTRDLLEPRSKLMGGLLTLVTGSLVNLVVLVGFAWFLAWLLSWLYATTGILSTTTQDGPAGAETTLGLTVPTWGSALSGDAPWIDPPDHWLVTWLVPTVAALLVIPIVWARVRAVMKVDQGNEVGRPTRRLARCLGPVVACLVLYLVAAVGIPSALYALNQLTVHSAPTQSAASVIRAMGFADDEFCRAGARESLQAAYKAADARAALSVGTGQEQSAGSCGRQLTVTVKRATAAEKLHTDEQLKAVIDKVVPVRAGSPGFQLASGATALLTLATTLALAVRRANVTEAEALTGWRLRFRKLFTSWLPFTALALVLGWLVLSWTLESTLRGAEPPSPFVPVLLSGVGLVVAVFVDANATAVHSYYRQRLHSAWAVGRTEDGVEELPAKAAYSFSDLKSVPLHVVTTANVRVYGQAPTRRGGIPLVFCPSNVTLVDDVRPCRSDMADYENCAGRGRVSVMAVVATSGAAVSPMAGRYSYGIAPFRLLLTLFNVRVGAWVANPLWGLRPPLDLRPPPWLISRAGAAQVFAEAIGASSLDDRWLYLSDGGHLDNTGLVEAARLHREGGRVVVVDASNDAVDSWSAVGDAIGVIRGDLGIDLRCVHGAVAAPPTSDAKTPESGLWDRFLRGIGVRSEKDEVEPQPYMRVYEAETTGDLLEVMVVKAVRPDTGDECLPESIRAFTLRTPEFPRSSTTRQDFGDVEFEAYRALGEHYMRLAWDHWQEHREAEGRPSGAGSPAGS